VTSALARNMPTVCDLLRGWSVITARLSYPSPVASWATLR